MTEQIKGVQIATISALTIRICFVEKMSWHARNTWPSVAGLSLDSMDDFVRMRKDNNFAHKILKGHADKIAEQLAKRDGR